MSCWAQVPDLLKAHHCCEVLIPVWTWLLIHVGPGPEADMDVLERKKGKARTLEILTASSEAFAISIIRMDIKDKKRAEDW
jgi:hypothetical protein